MVWRQQKGSSISMIQRCFSAVSVDKHLTLSSDNCEAGRCQRLPVMGKEGGPAVLRPLHGGRYARLSLLFQSPVFLSFSSFSFCLFGTVLLLLPFVYLFYWQWDGAVVGVRDLDSGWVPNGVNACRLDRKVGFDRWNSVLRIFGVLQGLGPGSGVGFPFF